MGECGRKFCVLGPVAMAAALMLASCNDPLGSHSDSQDEEGNNPPPPIQNDPPPPPPAPVPAPGSTPPSAIGAYRVEVGGFYIGRGAGNVGAGSATLDAQIKDDSGQTGVFHADLTLAHGHFIGTGTIMGCSLTCEGRVDPADPGASRTSVLLKPRLVGTFVAANGRHGRVIGQYDSSS